MTEINDKKLDTPFVPQRILITGVSGLMGRILFRYLTERCSIEYQVFGLDQHTRLSTRYELSNCDIHNGNTLFPTPPENFFQCDITDRTKLYEIVLNQRIDTIIHLAALLETHSDIERITFVNIEGTRNVFEAPGVRRVIYASSVMTVFGYLRREPYRSILNGTFDDSTMLSNFRKLTVADDPPLPDTESPTNRAYSYSKVVGEEMAAAIVKSTSSKSIICARFGWVNIDDQPGNTYLRTVWCSHRDLCSFVEKALMTPLYISGTYFVMSNNDHLWVDLDKTKKDLDFVPQDGAKN